MWPFCHSPLQWQAFLECDKFLPLLAPRGRQRTDGGGVSRSSGERNPRQQKKLFQALKGRQKEKWLSLPPLQGLGLILP